MYFLHLGQEEIEDSNNGILNDVLQSLKHQKKNEQVEDICNII